MLTAQNTSYFRGGAYRSILTGCMAVLLASATASAATSALALSNVGFDQPGGCGTALITYTLGEAPVIVTVDVQTNTLDNGGGEWVSLGGDIVKTITGDFGIVRKTGTCQARWMAAKDWPDHVVETGRIRAVVTAWATNAPPDWMVVGLKSDNDVRFYAASNHVPEGVGSDLYKGDQLLMRRIPASGVVWTMGLTRKERASGDTGVGDETNTPHRVMLTHDYFIGVYEVTQCQYTNIGMSAASGYSGYEDSWKRPASGLGIGNVRGNLPSPTAGYNVGSSSACGRLREKTGGKIDFDIPTEAQWEFACRAGWDTAYNNGGDFVEAECKLVGWYSGNATNETVDSKVQTHPVGLKLPNAFGLYDMHGNVQEWCCALTTFGDAYVGTFADGYENGAVTFDPVSGDTWSDVNKVILRGGSVSHGAKTVRSGNRGWGTYTSHYDYNGFRLCCPAVFR